MSMSAALLTASAILAVSFFTLRVSASDVVYSLEVLDSMQYPNAVCLDGSQGAYYLAMSPTYTTKWKFSFEGGGWCTGDADCYGRSLTALGSNVNLTTTAINPAGYCGGSFLSDEPTYSPGFSDWNAVYVPYCGGSSYTAKNFTPTVFEGHTIFYKEGFLLDALFSDLTGRHGMAAATDVAVAGCSAGGLTIYLNIDRIAAALPPAATVVGIPDAGWFLDHLTYTGASDRTPAFIWGFGAWNSSATLSASCQEAYASQGEQWKCIFAQYAAPYIQTPLFAVNSKFDACQLGGCEFLLPSALSNYAWPKYTSSDQLLATQYSDDFTNTLSSLTSQSQHGGFIDACLLHCQSGTSNWYSTVASDGQSHQTTIALALQAWYYNNTSVVGGPWWTDECATPPCNPTC